MKKLLTSLTATILVLFTMFSLTACTKAYVGEFHFESLTIKSSLTTTTIKSGENHNGVTLNADAYVLIINKDGTATLTSVLAPDQVQNFTWEEGEEKNTVILKDTEDDTSFTLVYEDGKATFTQKAGSMETIISFFKVEK